MPIQVRRLLRGRAMITIKRFIVFKFVWFFLFYAPLAFSLEECSFFSLERNIEEVQSRKAKGKIQDLFQV